LIPPALLGYEPDRPVYQTSSAKLEETEITVALSTSATNMYPVLSQEILGILERLGIRSRIIGNRAEQLTGEKTREVDLIMINWFADYPDADSVVFPLLSSRGNLYGGRSSTPETDRLIEQARTETDPDIRHSVYRRIEEEIRNQAIFIPLLHDLFQCFARPEVNGLELNYFYPLISFENLSIRR
jgi:ABC-type transport system substrate-binding protein